MSEKAELFLVPPHFTYMLKEKFEIARGEAKRRLHSPFLLSTEEIFASLAAGRFQLWTAYEGVEPPFMYMVTEVSDFKAGSIAIVRFLVGRDMRRILPLYEQFEAWVRKNGILYIQLTGDEKMTKILSRKGFTPTSYTSFKIMATVN